jgi:hypothetical protein
MANMMQRVQELYFESLMAFQIRRRPLSASETSSRCGVALVLVVAQWKDDPCRRVWRVLGLRASPSVG